MSAQRGEGIGVGAGLRKSHTQSLMGVPAGNINHLVDVAGSPGSQSRLMTTYQSPATDHRPDLCSQLSGPTRSRPHATVHFGTIYCVVSCVKSRRRPFRWSALAATAAFVGATIGFASIAGAATPGLRGASDVHPDGASAGTYLAGYRATPAGGLASASATFTVPKLTCTADEQAEDATLDLGVYTDDLSVSSFIAMSCGLGGPSYDYYLETPSGYASQPATPGDTVVTSLSESPTSTYAEIHDLTNGQYWFDDSTSPLDDTVVDIGSFNFETLNYPVPTFSTVTLSIATVNGDYLGFDSPTRYNALSGAETVIKTSGLKTSASGSSFSLTFKHSL